MLLCLFSLLLRVDTGTALPLDENFDLRVTNGDFVEDPADLPFMCRIHLQGGSKSHFCGAALISAEYLITVKHCLLQFYERCLVVEQCYVTCRDLNRARFDVGEFRVSILDVFCCCPFVC